MVQTLSSPRYSRNWARLPIDHKDPSLLLYLPLWSPYSDMAGATTIYSYDKNRHSGAITGTVWGLQGRTFDGLDDVIDLGDNNLFSFGNGTTDTPFSLMGWFKVTDVVALRPLAGKSALNAAEYGLWWLDASSIRVHIVDASLAVQCTRIMDVAPSLGVWLFVGVTYNGVGGASAGNGITMYLNGAVRASTATNNANYVAMENGTGSFMIGSRTEADIWHKGTSGDTWLYSKVLTANEIQQNYQSTKWRYGL